VNEIERFDVLVFGSGTGGKLTAWTSASEGLRTAVVERGLVGGSCPNIACLPTKNVIHSAKVADFVRHDRDFGSGTAPASIEMAEVRARKRRMVDGLVSMHMLYHPQIPELADLAGAFADVRIVLNHAGVPLGIGPYRGRHDEVFSRWAASFKALAAHPNVFIKVGGFGMRYNGLGFSAQSEPPSSEMVAATCRPYVETCIDAFGASRAMFESNFPVDKVSYSYPVFWNACKLIARGASTNEKRDLFAGTARRFYRLNNLG
jgi:predicted TIM-barrel fold metal-dependent hydrolase